MDSKVPIKIRSRTFGFSGDRGDGIITEIVAVGIAMIAFVSIYTLVNYLVISVHLQSVADQAVRASSSYTGADTTLDSRIALGDAIISKNGGNNDQTYASWTMTKRSIYLHLELHLVGSSSQMFSLLGLDIVSVHASSLLETLQSQQYVNH